MSERQAKHVFDNLENTSGLAPVGNCLLVELYKPQTHHGMIELAGDTVRQNWMAEQRAVIVECGPLCWGNEPVPRAKPGDHVIFGKYAGYQATGPGDGKFYRLIDDIAVFCVMTVHPEETGQFVDNRE